MGIYEALLRVKRAKKPFGLQKALNIMHYDPHRVLVTMGAIEAVVLDDGSKFHMTDQIDSVQRVNGNPWFEGIRPTDTVVDIGANIGAIAIPLARKADRVICFEPLFSEELQANIALNDLKNVKVHAFALSDRGALNIKFSSKERMTVPAFTFLQIKEIVDAPINFLKVDCEGGEWCIDPQDLEGIRELRLEFHVRRNYYERDMDALFHGWQGFMQGGGYSYEISEGDEPPPFHEIKRCFLLRASKK